MLSKPHNISNKGFTLIELLVVISIISLLSSIVLASLNSARVKARDASRALSIRQLKNALELYYSDYQVYPLIDSSSGGIPNRGYLVSDLSAADALPAPVSSKYIGKIPTEPNAGNAWEYVVSPARDAYGLWIWQEGGNKRCITGVNYQNRGWWDPGTGVPDCPF